MPATANIPAYHSKLGRIRMLGDDRALDLANTLHWRDGRLVDFIPDYSSLVEWSVPAGLMTAAEAKASLKRPDGKSERLVHKRFIELRSALKGWLSEQRKADLMPLLQDAMKSKSLPLQRSALAITNLVVFQPKGIIRQCEADPCGGYFLDTSRSKPRRWCAMDSCGNRAKVKKFRTKG